MIQVGSDLMFWNVLVFANSVLIEQNFFLKLFYSDMLNWTTSNTKVLNKWLSYTNVNYF